MKTDSIKLVAVNRVKELVLLGDGSQIRMENFVDRFGDDIDDAFEAVSAIAELPDGRWVVIDLTEFEHVVGH